MSFVEYFYILLNKILTSFGHQSDKLNRGITADRPSAALTQQQQEEEEDEEDASRGMSDQRERAARPRIPLTSVQSLPVPTPHHHPARFSTQDLAPVYCSVGFCACACIHVRSTLGFQGLLKIVAARQKTFVWTFLQRDGMRRRDSSRALQSFSPNEVHP